MTTATSLLPGSPLPLPGMPDGRAARYSPARLVGLVAAGTLLLAAVLAAAALFGGVPLHLRDALADVGPDGAIFWRLRLPRVAVGALVGAGLCTTGTALQALLQNPLADPFVLGVSGGAATGATLALFAGGLLGARIEALAGLSPQVACGFLGALVAAFLVRAVGSRGGRLVGAAALLAGAVLNAVAGALVLLAQLALSPQRAQQILLWLEGSLGYPERSTLTLSAVAIGVGCAGLCALAGRIRLLALGADEAAQLGVDVRATVRWTLAFSALAVAASVAVSGLIGFVGLLVPHLLRLKLGPDQRLLIPASILGGAAFLAAADALGRLCFLPLGIEPPVGAITALLGGPVFLWLLRRSLA